MAELDALREINAHLPFAHPIALVTWADREPIPGEYQDEF